MIEKANNVNSAINNFQCQGESTIVDIVVSSSVTSVLIIKCPYRHLLSLEECVTHAMCTFYSGTLRLNYIWGTPVYKENYNLLTRPKEKNKKTFVRQNENWRKNKKICFDLQSTKKKRKEKTNLNKKGSQRKK